MKKETCLGVSGRDGAMEWARAARDRLSAAATGEGAPPTGPEGLTLVLPLKDLFCKTFRIPSADAGETAVIARNMAEAEAPLDPAEMVFACETLETVAPGADGEGGSSLVMAVSAPVAAVDAARVAAGCDAGRIDRVEAFPFAMADFVAKSPKAASRGRQPVVAQIDGRVALMVLDGGRPLAVRDLGAAEALRAPALVLALRLALVQAERETSAAAPAPLLAFCDRKGGAAAAIEEAAATLTLGVEFDSPPGNSDLALAAARRTLGGAAQCNLFPEAWGGMLSERKFRARFVAGVAAAFVAWLALVGALFGWPAALGMHEKALAREVVRLEPEEEVVSRFRSRIRIIDRYSDRTWSPLEVLREVALALPQGVTLTMFRQDSGKREALVEAAARSSAPAYEFSNRLKESPLFARNDIVAGPTENRNTGRTTFQLRLAFADADGEGGAAK